MVFLESPSGDRYETDSAREITRLKARGYKQVERVVITDEPRRGKPAPSPEPDGDPSGS